MMVCPAEAAYCFVTSSVTAVAGVTLLVIGFRLFRGASGDAPHDVARLALILLIVCPLVDFSIWKR
ncbi:MAG: hypothetical protein ACXWCP_04385 [Burkholderiales bacterium]